MQEVNIIKHKKRFDKKKFALDSAANLAGSFIYAVGLVCFTQSAQIAPGGVSGLSIMINYMWGLPIGVLTLVLNIPLLILSYRFLGQRFTLRTVLSVLLCSVMIDMVVEPFFPVYVGNRLLGAVYGGVISGFGLSLIFMRGYTTGGTDIVSYLLRLKWPHISMGRAILFIDGLVIGLSMVVYKNFEVGLYAMISLFCSSRLIDTIVYGFDRGSMVIIVSAEAQQISERIMDEVGRGVTVLRAKGGYTGIDKDVLLCAVRNAEFVKLKSVVHQVDASAFIVAAEASQILGEGFNPVQ